MSTFKQSATPRRQKSNETCAVARKGAFYAARMTPKFEGTVIHVILLRNAQNAIQIKRRDQFTSDPLALDGRSEKHSFAETGSRHFESNLL
jgi:hypothetical protein